MKRLLVICALGALAAGCASDRGGTYDDTWNRETDTVNSGSNMQTNGPGMHSPMPEGMPGPGTSGAPNTWTGGSRP